MDPNARRSKLLTRFWGRHRVNSLDGLNDECLRVRIIDLSVVVVQNSISLVWQIWLVISGLGQNDQTVVKLGPTSFIGVLGRILDIHLLTDENRTRISSICKNERILMAIAAHNGRSRQLHVKMALLFQFLLRVQVGTHQGTLNSPLVFLGFTQPFVVV